MPIPAAAELPTSFAVTCGAASMHHVEHPGPAGLVEEMKDDVEQPRDAVADALALIFIARSDEGPVNEHGPADDVFVRHKTPIAAVETHVAVIAHGEDALRRD